MASAFFLSKLSHSCGSSGKRSIQIGVTESRPYSSARPSPAAIDGRPAHSDDHSPRGPEVQPVESITALGTLLAALLSPGREWATNPTQLRGIVRRAMVIGPCDGT